MADVDAAVCGINDTIAKCATEALRIAVESGAPVYVVIYERQESAKYNIESRVAYKDSPPEDAPCVVATPGDAPRVVADRITRLLAD